MAWRDAPHASSAYPYEPLDVEDETLRVGKLRPTMRTNVLLTKPELGKAKKSTFAPHDPEHVFGYHPNKDPEGAREIIGMWKENMNSRSGGGGVRSKPKPDFKTMNKMAVLNGVTRARDQPNFRAAHPVTLSKSTKPTDSVPKQLPSDYNPQHTYGLPSAHRTIEVVRVKGPVEPPIKHLVQGAYQDEWILENAHKGHELPIYVPPVPTRATLGHAIGAQKYIAPRVGGEEWKMAKFRNVESKVKEYCRPGGQRGFRNMYNDEPIGPSDAPTGEGYDEMPVADEHRGGSEYEWQRQQTDGRSGHKPSRDSGMMGGAYGQQTEDGYGPVASRSHEQQQTDQGYEQRASKAYEQQAEQGYDGRARSLPGDIISMPEQQPPFQHKEHPFQHKGHLFEHQDHPFQQQDPKHRHARELQRHESQQAQGQRHPTLQQNPKYLPTRTVTSFDDEPGRPKYRPQPRGMARYR